MKEAAEIPAKGKSWGLKVGVEACRILLGVVFIFSGTVKAVDPMGGAIKIDDYLTAFGLDFLKIFSVLFSMNLSALEFMLGVCMLLGVYRRYASLLTLLFMLVMTPLTLYLALFNPVSDCGCFGDAVVLTNWETFYKNIVLLAAAIVAFRYNQLLLPVYTYKVYWFVAIFAYLFSLLFSIRNYEHLPLLDFRPYKVGANIPALMEIPEGAPVDEYAYTFIYEKDGVQKEFTLENYPADDSTWTFVDSKTELIKAGYVPPITGFQLTDLADGTDQTEAVLSDSTGVFLLISPHLSEASDERIDEINNVYDYAQEKGLKFYGVTGSLPEEITLWTDYTGAEYPFLFCDETVLKTIIRSNPGLVLLQNGTILEKWHYNDIPAEGDLEAEMAPLLSGKADSSKEDAHIWSILLTFAVPLLLVWGYDHVHNRLRKRQPRPADGSPKEN